MPQSFLSFLVTDFVTMDIIYGAISWCAVKFSQYLHVPHKLLLPIGVLVGVLIVELVFWLNFRSYRVSQWANDNFPFYMHLVDIITVILMMCIFYFYDYASRAPNAHKKRQSQIYGTVVLIIFIIFKLASGGFWYQWESGKEESFMPRKKGSAIVGDLEGSSLSVTKGSKSAKSQPRAGKVGKGPRLAEDAIKDVYKDEDDSFREHVYGHQEFQEQAALDQKREAEDQRIIHDLKYGSKEPSLVLPDVSGSASSTSASIDPMKIKAKDLELAKEMRQKNKEFLEEHHAEMKQLRDEERRYKNLVKEFEKQQAETTKRNEELQKEKDKQLEKFMKKGEKRWEIGDDSASITKSAST